MAAQPNKTAEGTHWRKVHRRKNPNLLFAEDLGAPGASADVEIIDSGVTTVESVEGKDEMPWVGFNGKTKRLALNATNCKALQSICGTGVIERWRGWITLMVVRITYYDQLTKKKEETDAIRIAPQRPRARTGSPSESKAAPGNPEPSDEDKRAIEASERTEAGR